MAYDLIRSDRKSFSIQITPDGKVVVRAPRGLSAVTIDRFVQSNPVEGAT